MTQEETDFCRMAKINSDCSLRAWQIFKPRFYNGQTVTSLLEDKSSFSSNDRTLTGMVEVHNKKKIVFMNCQCVCLIFTLAAVHKDFDWHFTKMLNWFTIFAG